MLKRFLTPALMALTLAATLVSPPLARAQSAPPQDVSELVKLFSELCIADFPDDKKVSDFLSAHSPTSMPPAEVQRYLHSDPGVGYYLKTEIALYGITVEQPPFHTCAIRRMTPEGAAPDSMASISKAESAYVASIGGRSVPIPPTNSKTPNGPDVLSFGMGVIDSTNKPTDSFGIFLSNYHGRAPEPWAADATPGVGVEVRLTRQTIGR
jgi:hypothetical protein